MLGNVRVVAAMDEIPGTITENTVYVSRDGVVAHDSQRIELWIDEAGLADPMARKAHIRRLEEAQQLVQDQLLVHDCRVLWESCHAR